MVPGLPCPRKSMDEDTLDPQGQGSRLRHICTKHHYPSPCDGRHPLLLSLYTGCHILPYNLLPPFLPPPLNPPLLPTTSR